VAAFTLVAQQQQVETQTYIVSLDWTKICGPNWEFFYSTAEKQQKNVLELSLI
jgi:hypothetical protein